MIIKTLKLNFQKEKAHSLLNNFININRYGRIYADEDSFIFSSYLNKIEATIFEDRLKIIVKPKIELLFIPFGVFLLSYLYFELLLCACFTFVSYFIFVYEQIVVYSGIKRQLKLKKMEIME